MSTTPISVAETFFAHWNANRIEQALSMLSEDVLYDNVPLPNIIGIDNVRKFQSESGVGKTFTMVWKIINVAANGNVVLNERVDIFKYKNGGEISLPVMGTLTVENGQITVWRDYFDLGDFERQQSAIKL